LAKIGINEDLTKKEEKKIGEKKRGVREQEWKKIKKYINFYANEIEIKNAYFFDMPIIFFIYNEIYFNSNNLDNYLSSVCAFLLQNFNNIFPDEIPSRLPPIKRIEHQIYLLPRAFISN
jgi:hypothetical protein